MNDHVDHDQDAGDSFDWDKLRERIANLKTDLDDEVLSTEETQAILQGRAQALAKASDATNADDGEHLSLITFYLGGERYGIDIRHLWEILRPDLITPVPGVPAWLIGVITLRGAVLSVLSPGVLLGQMPAAWGPDARLLVVHAAGRTAGLLVDSVDAVLDVAIAALHPPLAHGWDDWHRHITHLTDDLVHVLDPTSLFGDPALLVQ